MDTAQWPQDIIVKPMEEIVPSTCSTKAASSASSLERKARPQKEQALNCPRCNSTNTKFCYYNNYSLTQPRYFCKTCRRYWTEGGSLRNIPVGGGSRKNKRSGGIHNPSSSTSTSSSSISSKKNLDLVINNPSPSLQNPKIHDHQGQDLNLGFSSATTQDFKTISELIQVPNFDNGKDNNSNNNSSHLSALEFISGISPRGLNSFFPMPITTDPGAHVYSSGFHPLPDFKPSLSFSLDGLGSYGSLQGVQDTAGGRLLFPFEDLKQVSSNTSADHTDQQNRDQNADPNGYWNGVIGGGSW